MDDSRERLEPAENVAPVGRLAPSPTGGLHLGNARTFLLAWLSIRARGGRVLMRIEDIDGPRVKPRLTERALEDLAWLGLDHDGEILVQSTRLSVYREAAERLVAAGHAYPCVCSRKEIEEAASAPHESGPDGPVYPGTCRDRFRTLDEAFAATGRAAALRFRVDRTGVPYRDRFRGEEEGIVRGDFVIQKRDGGPAYQLAVVVDDAASGVTEVVRGDDLVPSTPRQLLLYEALGFRPPRFAHVPLVLDASGARMAKRNDSTSLGVLRDSGFEAARVIAELARSSGFDGIGGRVHAADLIGRFDWRRVPRQAVLLSGFDL